MANVVSLRVLVSAPYFIPVLDEYRAQLERHGLELVLPRVTERLSEDELLAWVVDIDGTICGDDQYTAKVFQAARRLKVISKWGTGIDSLDLDAAARHGVRVYNTTGAFSDPVADTVMGYILSFARRIPWMDREVRGGCWRKQSGIALRESVLGVVGVGNIGKSVVRRARAFGMRVLGNDRVELPASFVAEMGLEVTTLDDLLRRADFVSLNCDLNPTSYHLIGQHELARMRPTAYLINTARGPIIDEPALVQALRNGTIAGAALDVFEQEPLPADSPLRSFDTCLLAPHNANNSRAAWRRVHTATIANLLDGLGVVG